MATTAGCRPAAQVDPLLELMTGRETLFLFGRLKNLPEASLTLTVDAMLEHVSLTPHADKPAVAYSGGNKRKLSLAIALLGGGARTPPHPPSRHPLAAPESLPPSLSLSAALVPC